MKLKMRKINKNSPIPLYYQLREEIIRLIKNGDLLPKEKLPAERELSSFHGVSRMTINKAINELVKSDYLIRQQGRGTFVRELPDQFSISPLASFSEQMKSKGLNPTSEIINFKVKKADELAELFAINPVNDLYYLERLRMIDNIPFLLEQTYLPAELLPDFKETDLTGNSLFKLLEDKYQIQLFQAEAAVEPILIEGKLAEKMQIKTSVLGLAIQQKTFSQSDRLIEFTQAYYRSDQYKFKLKFNKKNLKEEK